MLQKKKKKNQIHNAKKAYNWGQGRFLERVKQRSSKEGGLMTKVHKDGRTAQPPLCGEHKKWLHSTHIQITSLAKAIRKSWLFHGAHKLV